MSENQSDFFQKSKIVVEEFLQSVVIVDDRAFYIKTEDESLPDTVITPDPFPEIGIADRGKKARKAPVDVEPSEFETEDDTHNLDAKSIVDSFAKKGIVCAVIEPSEGDMSSLTETVLKLTLRTDIVVLDWSLGQDKGKKVLEILKTIVASDTKNPQQLRLIIIYTANPKITDVSDQIKALLNEVSKKVGELGEDFKVGEFDEGFTFEALSVRIVIYAKQEARIPEIYDAHKVSFPELADRITSEFTFMTYGLVSNTVLKSLSRIRANTYRILRKFSRSMDAPYLTHRVLLPIPSDAEELLPFLISKDLQGILEDADICSLSDFESISIWVKDKIGRGITYKHKSNQGEEIITFTEEQVLDLINRGIKNWDQLGRIGSLTKWHKLNLSKMLSGYSEETEFLDERFAYLTFMRSFYEYFIPALTLGTILKRVRDNTFWICLQPSCDTVRLVKPEAFPFLPITSVVNEGKCDIVLDEGGTFSKFIIEKKLQKINVITFNPDPVRQKVTASKEENGDNRFVDSENYSYKWIGELRQEFALKLSNELSSNLTRVGIDQSEWLRKLAE